MTTMNLIQMQQALQTLPMQNVIQYANGSDPTVPAYLALTELNRRKQIQDTAAASQQVPQQTVKQNVESALTSPKTDMTQAPQQTDMTQAPQQTDLTQAPTGQINPAAPVNPAASQFKHGGLTALPINMFKEKNFAHGGIVAFGTGTLDKTVGDAANEQAEDVIVGGPNVQGDTTGTALPSSPPLQQQMSSEASNSENPSNAGIASINPNTQLSNTPSGTIPPAGLQQMIQQAQNKVSDLYSTPSNLQQQPVQSLAEIQANQREAERLAGVSEDPLKATRERYQAIEAKQKEGASGDALDRLIAQASAFATADPTKGFGYAAGISATASQNLKKEQNALREQQAMTMAKLYSEFDKEDEARKRGDSKGMLDAQQKIKDHNDKLAELENQRMQAQALQANAMTNAGNLAITQHLAGFKPDEIEALKKQAEAAKIHADASLISANKPTGAIDYDRYATNPAYAAAVDAVKTLGNVSKTDAQIRTEFQKSLNLQDEWRDKGGEEAYMAEQRRILGTGTGNPSTASGTDSQGNPTVRGKDGKNYPQTIVKDNVTLHYDAESGVYRR